MMQLQCGLLVLLLAALTDFVWSGSIRPYDPKQFVSKTNPTSYFLWSPPVSKEPVVVNVSLQLNHFGPLDEPSSVFQMLLHMEASWHDSRLSLAEQRNSSDLYRLEADQWHLLRVWRPAIHLANANPYRSSLLSDRSKGEMTGVIDGNGRVQAIKRIRLKGTCNLNFKYFPMDVQHCRLQFESSSLSTSQLRLQWHLPKAVKIPEGFKWAAFDLIDLKVHSSKLRYAGDTVGPYSRLEVIFSLRRQLGYYLFNVYLPSTLFVMASWCSFWIDIPAAPARVALVLTTMLTHVTSTKAVLPHVSYICCLDVWVLMCTMFIFAAIVEYATANYFYHKPSRVRDKGKVEQTMLPLPSQSQSAAQCMEVDLNANPVECGSTEDVGGRWAARATRTARQLGTSIAHGWHRCWQTVIPPFHGDFVPRRTALAIDRRSRFIFPLLFLLFNLLYWTIILCYTYNQAC